MNVVRMRLLPKGLDALEWHKARQIAGIKVEERKINLMGAPIYQQEQAYYRNDGCKHIASRGVSC